MFIRGATLYKPASEIEHGGLLRITRMKLEPRDTHGARPQRAIPEIQGAALYIRRACVHPRIRECVHARATYAQRARRYLLTCYVLVRRAPAVHRHAINREEGRRGGGSHPVLSCWCTLARLAPMNIFMSGEHGARSSHPSLSSASICFFLSPATSAAVLLAHPLHTGGRNRIDPSFDRQLN